MIFIPSFVTGCTPHTLNRTSLAALPSSHHAVCVISPSPAPQTQPCWRRCGYSSTPDQSWNQSFVMNSFLGKMETAELFPFPEGTHDQSDTLQLLSYKTYCTTMVSLSLSPPPPPPPSLPPSNSVNRRTETKCWHVY